jgi:hypothetical protein
MVSSGSGRVVCKFEACFGSTIAKSFQIKSAIRTSAAPTKTVGTGRVLHHYMDGLSNGALLCLLYYGSFGAEPVSSGSRLIFLWGGGPKYGNGGSSMISTGRQSGRSWRKA